MLKISRLSTKDRSSFSYLQSLDRHAAMPLERKLNKEVMMRFVCFVVSISTIAERFVHC